MIIVTVGYQITVSHTAVFIAEKIKHFYHQGYYIKYYNNLQSRHMALIDFFKNL